MRLNAHHVGTQKEMPITISITQEGLYGNKEEAAAVASGREWNNYVIITKQVRYLRYLSSYCSLHNIVVINE